MFIESAPDVHLMTLLTNLKNIHDIGFNFDRRVGVLVGGFKPFVVEWQAEARHALLGLRVIDGLGRGLEGAAADGGQQQGHAAAQKQDGHVGEKIDLGPGKVFWQPLRNQKSFYHISTISRLGFGFLSRRLFPSFSPFFALTKEFPPFVLFSLPSFL